MSTSSNQPAAPLPSHIGIIMDGNGRWAKSRNLPRSNGHLEGLKTAKKIVKAASDQGIKFLTLYTFSTENWKRASEEVGFLMGLIQKYLIAELDFYRQNKIRIKHCGDLSGLPPDIVDSIERVAADTADYAGLTVVLAINYGGRDEIVRAVRKMASDGLTGQSITEAAISVRMDNPDVPDPDLIIRTASEYRISNFLLWEAAYAEYYFSDKLWPDWESEDLAAAIRNYSGRDRRFGGVKA
jgi:undecaprenyl diphosphate synthase